VIQRERVAEEGLSIHSLTLKVFRKTSPPEAIALRLLAIPTALQTKASGPHSVRREKRDFPFSTQPGSAFLAERAFWVAWGKKT
jgi:hypothetical protein